jgi:hypothetical protein
MNIVQRTLFQFQCRPSGQRLDRPLGCMLLTAREIELQSFCER